MKKKTNIHNFLRRKAQLFLFFFFSSNLILLFFCSSLSSINTQPLRIVHSEPNIDEMSESTEDSQQPKKFMYISVYYLYLALRVWVRKKEIEKKENRTTKLRIFVHFSLEFNFRSRTLQAQQENRIYFGFFFKKRWRIFILKTKNHHKPSVVSLGFTSHQSSVIDLKCGLSGNFCEFRFFFCTE